MRRVISKEEAVTEVDRSLRVVGLVVPLFGILEIDPILLMEFRWTHDLLGVVVESSTIDSNREEETSEIPSVSRSSSFTPGSLLSDPCPSCGGPALMVLYPVVSRAFVERYALVLGKVFGSRPSEGRGTRWQVDGIDLDAFRCESCGSAFVNGPSLPGVFLEVPSEA